MADLTDKIKYFAAGLGLLTLTSLPLEAQQGESYYLKKFKKENICLPKKSHKIEQYKNLSLITYRKYNYCSSTTSQKEKAFRHELAQVNNSCVYKQAKRYNKYFDKQKRQKYN